MSERGSTVILEMGCRDAYQAIQLAEVLAAGIEGDGFTLVFGKEDGRGQREG